MSPDSEGWVRLRGESPQWPHSEPLRIRVEHAGCSLCEKTIETQGSFDLGFRVATNGGSNGDPIRVLLRVNRTFVPKIHGYSAFDDRPVSFIVR